MCFDAILDFYCLSSLIIISLLHVNEKMHGHYDSELKTIGNCKKTVPKLTAALANQLYRVHSWIMSLTTSL
jgi:hypothetical protein